MTTGPLHWELLQRGRCETTANVIQLSTNATSFCRAVDNQVYVSMCSPARDMSAGYHAVRVFILEQLDCDLKQRKTVGPFDGC